MTASLASPLLLPGALVSPSSSRLSTLAGSGRFLAGSRPPGSLTQPFSSFHESTTKRGAVSSPAMQCQLQLIDFRDHMLGPKGTVGCLPQSTRPRAWGTRFPAGSPSGAARRRPAMRRRRPRRPAAPPT